MSVKKIQAKNFFEKNINKLFVGNLAWTFGLIFLVVTLTIGKRTFTNQGQWIGNVVFSSLFLAFSWVFNLFIVFRSLKQYKQKGYTALYTNKYTYWTIITSLIIPGAFINIFINKQYVIKHKLVGKNWKNLQKDFEHKKNPVSVYSILFWAIVITVFVIYLIYFIDGNQKLEDGSDGQIPGLLNIFLAPLQGLASKVELIAFLFAIGGFLAVINETKALEAGIGSLINKNKEKEIRIIPILIILLSLGGTTFGMCEETLPFYVILTPILVGAGFDALTAVLTILLGAGIGVIGSILNPFVISAAIDASGTSISTFDGGIVRIFGYVALVAIVCVMVTMYAHKVKKDPTKSILYVQGKETATKFNFKDSSTPIFDKKSKLTVAIFALTFVALVFVSLDWNALVGFNGFEELRNTLNTYFPFLFNVSSVGSWGFIELGSIFTIATFLISLLYWKDEKHLFKTFLNGCIDMLSPVIVVSMASSIGVLLSSSGVDTFIANGMAGLLGANAQLSIILLFMALLLLSIVIPSTTGLASAVFGILGQSITTASIPGLTVSGTITTFSYASGFINISSPTAVALVGGLSLSKVSIHDYYKVAWKHIAVIGAMCMLIIIVGTLLPAGWF